MDLTNITTTELKDLGLRAMLGDLFAISDINKFVRQMADSYLNRKLNNGLLNCLEEEDGKIVSVTGGSKINYAEIAEGKIRHIDLCFANIIDNINTKLSTINTEYGLLKGSDIVSFHAKDNVTMENLIVIEITIVVKN